MISRIAITSAVSGTTSGRVRLHPLRRYRPKLVFEVDLRPPRLRHLGLSLTGKGEHLVHAPVGIADRLTRIPEGAQFVVAEDARAHRLLADDCLRLQAVAWRSLDTVDVLVDCPTEQAPCDAEQIVRLRWCIASHCGLDHRSHVEGGDFRDRSPAPLRDKLAPDVKLDLPALPFGRELLCNEILGDGRERIGPLSLFSEPLALLNRARVPSLPDQFQPTPGLPTGFCEPYFAQYSNRPPCRVVAAGVARGENERPAALVGHPHTEPGDDRIHHIVPFARRRRLERLDYPVVERSLRHRPSDHRRNTGRLELATIWQQNSCNAVLPNEML